MLIVVKPLPFHPDRLFRYFYGELIVKCQFKRLRNRKLLKLRKPYLSLLINLSLLLIPSTVPRVSAFNFVAKNTDYLTKICVSESDLSIKYVK